jgi:hypothetical protein
MEKFSNFSKCDVNENKYLKNVIWFVVVRGLVERETKGEGGG